MPSEDAGVCDYLSVLTGRCRAVIGADLLGVYAGGSLALDGYQAGRSDIDVAVLCGPALTLPVKRAIVAELRHENLRCPARGLELVVYRSAVAAAGEPDPGFEVELNSGERMAFRATYDAADRAPADGLFWYAIDRSILAERGLTVAGPAAAEVFTAPVEPVLIELLIDSLRWHLASSAAAGDDAVLNACRALHRVRTGRWVAKRAAGLALRTDHRPGTGGGRAGGEVFDLAVVEQALLTRDGGPAPDALRVRRFQRQVMNVLQRRHSR